MQDHLIVIYQKIKQIKKDHLIVGFLADIQSPPQLTKRPTQKGFVAQCSSKSSLNETHPAHQHGLQGFLYGCLRVV